LFGWETATWRARVIDTAAESRAYLDYLGGGRNDPEVTQSFVDHALEALRFFEAVAKGALLYGGQIAGPLLSIR
jgi:hypothetical protein